MRSSFFSLFIAAALVAPATALAGNYTIDPSHSEVSFSVRHMTVSTTKGHFRKFEGTVTLDDKAPAKSQIDVSIDTASVNTEDEKRDQHLRSADFFNVEKFPKMTFKSKKIKVVNNTTWDVTGDLTIHGVTREVVLPVRILGMDVKDPWGGVRGGAEASTTINRKDFGIVWNKALDNGGVVLSDEVKIEINIELIKKS